MQSPQTEIIKNPPQDKKNEIAKLEEQCEKLDEEIKYLGDLDPKRLTKKEEVNKLRDQINYIREPYWRYLQITYLPTLKEVKDYWGSVLTFERNDPKKK